jgi:hypothetical protein
MAADLLPTHKAPPPPVATEFNWTGCYLGVNAAAAFSSSSFDVYTPPTSEPENLTRI